MNSRRKRADRQTGGIFPEIERDPGERFAARENRPWTAAQQAVLVAGVCRCRSADAYALTCPPLYEAVGHKPVDPPDTRPTIKVYQDTCVRGIELRIVTLWMGRYTDWTPQPPMGFHHTGDGPLTWGEKVKILRPYHRRVTESKTVIGYWELLRMLGRPADDRAVADYLHKLRGPKFLDDGDPDARPVVTDENKERLAAQIVLLDVALENKDFGDALSLAMIRAILEG